MILKNFIHEILSDVELEKIAQAISKQELRTSGELKVSIKRKRSFLDKKKNIRELAIREFHRLGLNNTRERSGILFFLLLKDREFYILPDIGITEKLPQEFWDELAKETIDYFIDGRFFEGIINVIQKCGEVLAKHYPVKPEDRNEISNRVEIT